MAGIFFMESFERGAFKHCACGRKYNKAQWDKLPNKHIIRYPWKQVEETRDCECGSTIHATVEKGDPEEV